MIFPSPSHGSPEPNPLPYPPKEQSWPPLLGHCGHTLLAVHLGTVGTEHNALFRQKLLALFSLSKDKHWLAELNWQRGAITTLTTFKIRVKKTPGMEEKKKYIVNAFKSDK